MSRYTLSFSLALLVLNSIQAHASGLQHLAQAQSNHLQPRKLGGDAQEEQPNQRYLSSDERMPEECNGMCEKFTRLTADCRIKNGTAWQHCVCMTENFDAWNTCASCAPGYYDIYDGGFAGFFKNALSECEAVGFPVTLTTKLPESKLASGKPLSNAVNNDGQSIDAKDEDSLPAAGSSNAKAPPAPSSTVRMGGTSKTSGSSHTYIGSSLVVLAVSGTLAWFISV